MDNILIFIIFVFILELFFIWPTSYNKLKNKNFQKSKQKKKTAYKKDRDILVQMGNYYESLVGRDFEDKSDLVIYNGFIKGNQDGGIDLIAFNKNIIYLIQCKNWHKMELHIDKLEQIYIKLSKYNFACFDFQPKEIQKHLQKKKNLKEIEILLLKMKINKDRKVGKYLFLSNEEVITKHVKARLKKINNYLYKYKDMNLIIYED